MGRARFPRMKGLHCLGLATLGVSLLVPTASAALELSPGTPTETTAERVVIPLTISLDCQSMPTFAALAGSGDVPITLQIEGDSSQIRVEHDQAVLRAADCALDPMGRAVAMADLRLLSTNETRALHAYSLVLTAHPPPAPDGVTPPPPSTPASAVAFFPFVGSVSFNAKLTEQQSGPQTEIPFRIDAVSSTNGNVKILYELAEDAPPGWTIIPPQSLILSGAGHDADRGKSVVTVSTPHNNGQNREQIEFELIAKPEAADDSSIKLEPTRIKLIARVEGFYIPSVPPAFVMGLLATAGVLARRRLAA